MGIAYKGAIQKQFRPTVTAIVQRLELRLDGDSEALKQQHFISFFFFSSWADSRFQNYVARLRVNMSGCSSVLRYCFLFLIQGRAPVASGYASRQTKGFPRFPASDTANTEVPMTQPECCFFGGGGNLLFCINTITILFF